MITDNQLNTAWLAELTNPHHDGTTQQIDDFAQAYVTDNQVFIQKRTALHQARQVEDNVWLTSQRDPVVPRLADADKQQDGYISAARYINLGHTQLPDGEPTKAEALECEQVFKDFKFSTRDAYGAESDKIIQMQQNLQAHEAFLTSIGAWTFFTKAVTAAQHVRQLLGERAMTMGEFVKGEMKAARRATDLAIADLYKTVMAMMELMPSAELTTLYTQLRGIELYARQYYLSGSGSSNQNNQNNSENSGNSGENNGGDLPPSGGGETGGDDNGSGDNGGGGLPSDPGGEVGDNTGGNGGGGLPSDPGGEVGDNTGGNGGGGLPSSGGEG